MGGRPLEGKVVAVTRPRAQAAGLIRVLEERGATALLAPAIRISPAASSVLDRALGQVARGEFQWVVFTSRAGVEAIAGRSPGALHAASVAAVGEGTAKALRDAGIEPVLIPSTFTTEALARAMPWGHGRVLLARADIAPEGLERALRRKGWQTERIDAYRTTFPRSLPVPAARALRNERLDAVTFTSASTVEGFVRLAGPLRGPKVVCIGPVTAGAARRAGMRVAAVARPHTIEGLVAAVERALGPKRRRRKEPRIR